MLIAWLKRKVCPKVKVAASRFRQATPCSLSGGARSFVIRDSRSEQGSRRITFCARHQQLNGSKNSIIRIRRALWWSISHMILFIL